jgi:signal transduction histidine kinase
MTSSLKKIIVAIFFKKSLVRLISFYYILAIFSAEIIALSVLKIMSELHAQLTDTIEVFWIAFITTTCVALPLLIKFSIVLKKLSAKNKAILESKEALNIQKNELTLTMDKLRIARDLALEASEIKSRFLANMSHEFRTPLNAIIGYTELLLEECAEISSPQVVEDLEKVQNSSRKLLDLVNDILDLAKIEAGKDQVHFTIVPLGLMVSEAIDVIKHLTLQNRNELVVDIEDHLTDLYSDPGKLRRCLINLLSNACKFTKDGKITLKVWKEWDANKSTIYFSVKDTGIGMSAEEISRIFDYFTQADETTTRQYGGSGLGLTITQKMMHLMSGDIKVESKKGIGSVFTLILPQNTISDVEQNS